MQGKRVVREPIREVLRARTVDDGVARADRADRAAVGRVGLQLIEGNVRVRFGGGVVMVVGRAGFAGGVMLRGGVTAALVEHHVVARRPVGMVVLVSREVEVRKHLDAEQPQDARNHRKPAATTGGMSPANHPPLTLRTSCGGSRS